MKDSKLFEALETLNAKEFNKFLKFLRSPYINENRNILLLADYLQEIYPEFTPDKLDRLLLYKVVYDDEFNDLRLRHLLSDLLKLLELFLSIEGFLSDEQNVDMKKLVAFRDRELNKHYQSTDRKLRKKIGDTRHFGDDLDYFKKYALEKEMNQYMEVSNQRAEMTNIAETSEALDNYFVLQKLRYGCIQANYGNVFSKSLKLFLLDEIVDYVSEVNISDYPLIRCYYLALQMFKNSGDTIHYFTYKEALKEHNQVFTKHFNVELYKFAQNYCIGRINKGESAFFNEIFELYKQTLSNGVAFSSGELSPTNFKNMVTVGCYLKQFAWVQDFIRDYISYLPEEHQENSRVMMTALVYWNLEKRSEAVRLLSRVEYDDPFYALDSRSLLMKIYFELGEYEVLRSLCESFKIYLKRNKTISEAHINNYTGLIKYTLKLIKVKPWQHEKLLDIKSEITTAPSVYNRSWLLDQIKHMQSEFMNPMV